MAIHDPQTAGQHWLYWPLDRGSTAAPISNYNMTDHNHIGLENTVDLASRWWTYSTEEDSRITYLIELVNVMFKSLKPYIPISDAENLEQKINNLIQGEQPMVEEDGTEHLDDNLFEL